VGVGYRRPLAPWIASRPSAVECVEITAEHFFDRDGALLQRLRADYPLFVHGLGLSLGTPGPLDPAVLAQFARVVEQADPEWVSEHVAFTRTADVDLGHLNPVAPTRAVMRRVAAHARELADRCGKPVILENITSHLRLTGELSEPEFLNGLCELAGCGLLLDVTNLWINARNHRFDPVAWLQAVDPAHIVQLHIVGYARTPERYEDTHAHAIQPELHALLEALLAHAAPRAIIIERDAQFPPPAELESELEQLKRAVARAEEDHHGRRTRPGALAH
jgi:uncharacterized protein (UPF0276 family)